MPYALMFSQLEEAKKSMKQCLDELEGSTAEQHYHKSLEMVEEALKEREREVARMKAAEKARVCIHYISGTSN